MPEQTIERKLDRIIELLECLVACKLYGSFRNTPPPIKEFLKRYPLDPAVAGSQEEQGSVDNQMIS